MAFLIARFSDGDICYHRLFVFFVGVVNFVVVVFSSVFFLFFGY